MIRPFIYTRTKNYDYRVVTLQSLSNVSNSFVHFATEIARTLIDAENDQLIEPTWALVRKDGYILWGIAIINKVLGDQNQDKYRRPVRGFFGFITDGTISKLPFSVSFFRDLYAKYVLPIWDSYEQTEQVTESMPAISGFDYIERSSCLSSEINVDDSICRIFPSAVESKLLIEAVFAASCDCSIATNIHGKKQVVEFGKDRISFANAVMSSDSSLKGSEDIKVFVLKERSAGITDLSNGNNIVTAGQKHCPLCGSPIFQSENVCSTCKNHQRKKKHLKYGLYVFMAIICLMLMFNGNSIWEKILSPKHQQEKVYNEEDKQKGQEGRINTPSSFLTTTKQKVNVSDANPDDIFKFAYESSSLITQVEPTDNWIRIMTSPQQFSEKGIIEFTCDPLLQGRREGGICITNDEGIKTIIPIYQTVSTGNTDVDNTYHSSHGVDNKATLHNVIVGESDVESSGDAQNFGTTPIVEPVNH